MRFRAALFFLALLTGVPAYGQDVAVPGLVADFTDESSDDEIIVTAPRRETPLPMPYESHIRIDPLSLTVEEDHFGCTRFTATRPIFDLGEDFRLEYHRVTEDGCNQQLFSEESPQDWRFAYRW